MTNPKYYIIKKTPDLYGLKELKGKAFYLFYFSIISNS